MNKKGQSLGLSLMSGIFILIIGLVCINFIMGEVIVARAELLCSSAESISDGTKLLCLVIDTTVPYWIFLIFSIIIVSITARLLL